MSEHNKKYCEYCEEEIPFETESVYKGYILCDDCLEQYNDKTEYCCISGNCNSSC